LLRLLGDPAVVMAGPDATPEQIAAVRGAYGLDRSVPEQFLAYLSHLARGDFGASLSDGTPALAKVLAAFPASLMLAGLAMAATLAIALPLGIWLGGAGEGVLARILRGVLFALQGVPGFVVALLLVQVFAISLVWLPALGFAGPASWILPAASVAAFLTPKLARLIEANVIAALASPYVRTARAAGLGAGEILWGQAAGNALLGAVALIGAQAAFLVTGLVIIETIFAWPGIGLLLIQSTTNLDFPVVQAITLLVSVAVFLVNGVSEQVQRWIDPRLAQPEGAL
jgi:peptide/nickel transport system permease protein